jgi:hypothetical protein
MAAWPFRSQYIGGLGEKRSSAVNNGVMTRSPRHRPRQFGYILVEQCRREKIQPIFRQALKRGRGIVHRGWLFDDQPYSIFVSNEADFHGSWIKVGNAGFHLSFDLFQRWRNHRSWTRPGFGWQVPSYQAYVVGLDGRRYTYLLMTPTRLIGTVGDMAASYAMSRLSTKQRRTHRRHQLLKQIFPWATPVWLDRNAAAYVPRDQDKPKDWKPVHWNQVVGELVTVSRRRRGWAGASGRGIPAAGNGSLTGMRCSLSCTTSAMPTWRRWSGRDCASSITRIKGGRPISGPGPCAWPPLAPFPLPSAPPKVPPTAAPASDRYASLAGYATWASPPAIRSRRRAASASPVES